RQGVRGRFDDLVRVGVVEPAALILARHQARSLAEVVDAARLLVLREDLRDGDRAVRLELRFPEAAGDLDLLQPHGLDGVVRRRLRQEPRARQAARRRETDTDPRTPGYPCCGHLECSRETLIMPRPHGGGRYFENLAMASCARRRSSSVCDR